VVEAAAAGADRFFDGMQTVKDFHENRVYCY
jgi:hypothetical protein